MLWRQFDYDNWSNGLILRRLRELDPPPDRSVQLLGHILHTKRMWLLRIQGQKTLGYDLRPTVDLEACAELVEELGPAYAEELSEIGTADMLKGVRYHSRKGIPHHTSLFDILSHVLVHGATHRGQIEEQLREAGCPPPPDMDYITYAREEYVENSTGDFPGPREDD